MSWFLYLIFTSTLILCVVSIVVEELRRAWPRKSWQSRYPQSTVRLVDPPCDQDASIVTLATQDSEN